MTTLQALAQAVARLDNIIQGYVPDLLNLPEQYKQDLRDAAAALVTYEAKS